MVTKKMVRWLVLLCVMSSAFSTHPTVAQASDAQWVYVLAQTDTTFELIRINTETRIAESAFTINKTPQMLLRDVLPVSELEAAKFYRRERKEDDSRVASWLGDSKPQVAATLLGVASDGQAVAIGVIYEHCIDHDYAACFGVTQIVVVSPSDKSSYVAWILPHHAREYAPENCSRSSGFFLRIRDLRWTPDNTHFVIRFTGGKWCFLYSSPLVIVPSKAEGSVIVLGEVRFWDFAGSSNKIVAITSNTEVAIDEFNSAGHSRHMQQFHDPVIFDETHFNNIAFLNGKVLIFGGHPINEVDRLYILDPVTANLTFGSLGRETVRGSFDGQTAILAGADGTLSVATLTGDELNLRLLLTDVKFWQQNASGELLIQHTLQSSYSIVDLQGNMKSILYVTEEIDDLENRLGKTLYQPELGQFEIMW